jgi:hypothetical protein
MSGSSIEIGAKRPVSEPGRWQAGWWDWFGVAASVGCAIHCAAMPFVAAFLPMLGLSFLAETAFHKVMVIVCSGLALAAFLPGWSRHRQLLPVAIAGVGLALISLAAFALEGNCCISCTTIGWPKQWWTAFTPWITPLGGLVLVVAHLSNRCYVASCCIRHH